MKQSSKSKMLIIIGLVMIGFMVMMSFIAPIFYQVDPNQMTVAGRLSQPFGTYIFGTDEFGRDLLARLMTGGKISLAIGFVTTLASFVIGSILGMYGAWYPKVGNILMRFIDGLMAIPGILLAIALTSVFGGSIQNIMISLTIISIPIMTRIARASTIQVMNEPYIVGMKIIGASTSRILWRHIYPNAVPSLLVQSSFVFANAILSEASLSYLGAGIAPPTASWGNMIQGGKNVIFQAWWIVLLPALAVLISVLGFNIFGEGMRLKLERKQSD